VIIRRPLLLLLAVVLLVRGSVMEAAISINIEASSGRPHSCTGPAQAYCSRGKVRSTHLPVGFSFKKTKTKRKLKREQRRGLKTKRE